MHGWATRDVLNTYGVFVCKDLSNMLIWKDEYSLNFVFQWDDLNINAKTDLRDDTKIPYSWYWDDLHKLL